RGNPTSVSGAGSIIGSSNPFEMPVMAPGPSVEINSRTGVLDIAGVVSIQVLDRVEIWASAVVRSDKGDFLHFPDHPDGGDGITYLITTSTSTVDAIPIHVTIPRDKSVTPGVITVEPIVWVRYVTSSSSSMAFTFDPRITV